MQGTSSVGDGPVSVSAAESSLPLDTNMDPEVMEEGHPQSNAGNGHDFIEVVSKAQRRRQRGSATKDGAPPAQPQTNVSTASASKRKPALRPQPLPRDDFKLVLRPQGGLRLGDVEYAEISLALLNATHTTWRQANLKLRIDTTQNTATVSTPFCGCRSCSKPS